MDEVTRTGQVSRREVLKKTLLGAAGLTVLPTVLAACGNSSATPTGAPGSLSGTVTLGSNYSDAVPKKAMADMAAAFTKKTTVTVKVNTVDHGTFQNQITSYLGGKPEDVFTWFSGFRMRFFAAQNLAVAIDDVWASSLTANYSAAFKTGSTGDDGHQYFVPIYNYPWAVFYRKSLFTEKGYTVPTTMDDFKTLCQKIQTDGLVPIAFADKDGWPAMGTFDILNLRMNGYQFHVDLMAGKEKWTDAKVIAVFNAWKDLMPYHQTGAAGRIWQDAAQALVKKQAAMYLLGMFVSQQFSAVDAATLADLDFFPFPNLGTSFDAEKALDAPIDGFMIAAKSAAGQAGQDQTNAKAFVGFLGTGAAQDIYVAADPSNIAAAKDANTSKYNALQQKAVQLISSAQKITQFMDRDTRPDFATATGMQNFILKFVSDPSQDLTAFTKTIQAFWDALPPAS